MAAPLQICPPAPRWGGLWLALALLSFSLRAGGQNLPVLNASSLKFAPQHVVMSGYWLEVEHQRARHPQQSLTLTPQLYYGPTGRPDGARSANPLNEDESVRGFGVQGQHRFYVVPARAAFPAGLYVSYGPHFQHFLMTFHRSSWREIQGPGNLPYYEYGPVRFTEKIIRYGGSMQVGYQAPLPPGPVFIDLFMGLGWRQSHSNSAIEGRQYRSGSSNYGHQGFYFPAGVKIGVALSALRPRPSATM
ncbi:hypothetical protein SAMN00120144_1119 [Hymenobacter roseosalivarius DSM 11622]|uniref:DUF3575 domain-containing protein n=1 Tax=Hymenobacter roseosalivarius DSM 11622 TaxID=645990 RepID=A0A1W1V4L7_9BACT|nr:hypothetical protein [Hymenobacter roseosalivarius]SMB87971.1 hypothetical protein SAMN00120144_1119 [Hymenobacter roseosalivarius DSM 11622]